MEPVTSACASDTRPVAFARFVPATVAVCGYLERRSRRGA